MLLCMLMLFLCQVGAVKTWSKKVRPNKQLPVSAWRRTLRLSSSCYRATHNMHALWTLMMHRHPPRQASSVDYNEQEQEHLDHVQAAATTVAMRSNSHPTIGACHGGAVHTATTQRHASSGKSSMTAPHTARCATALWAAAARAGSSTAKGKTTHVGSSAKNISTPTPSSCPPLRCRHPPASSSPHKSTQNSHHTCQPCKRFSQQPAKPLRTMQL